MKGHIGGDSRSKLIHSVMATPANVHDSRVLAELLRGNQTRVWGDSSCARQRDVIARTAPAAQVYTQKDKERRNRPLSNL